MKKNNNIRLFLDDERFPADCKNYVSDFDIDPSIYDEPWAIVRNYKTFTEFIEMFGMPKIISFDHDLADFDEDGKDTEAVACTGIQKQYMPWARLLKRVFGIDIETCPHCQGKLKIISAIEDPAIIAKILKHLGLPTRAPPRKPARYTDIYDSR